MMLSTALSFSILPQIPLKTRNLVLELPLTSTVDKLSLWETPKSKEVSTADLQQNSVLPCEVQFTNFDDSR